MSYTVFSRKPQSTTTIIGYRDSIDGSIFAIEYPNTFQYIPALGDILNSLPNLPVNTTLGKGLIPFAPQIAFDTSHTQCFEQISAAPSLQISPKISGVVPVAGSRAIVSVVGNGVDSPILVGFNASNGSSGYDGRQGVVNVFEFIFTGYDYYYSCWQSITGLPLPGNGGSIVTVTTGDLLTFGGLFGLSLNGAGGYSAVNASWNNAYMISTADIATDGYINGRFDSALMLGFSQSSVAGPYTAPWNYVLWGNTGANYSSINNGGAIVSSSIPVQSGDTLRLKRTGGTVTGSVLRAGTVSFVDIVSYPTASTAPIFANVAMLGSGSIYDLRGGGF